MKPDERVLIRLAFVGIVVAAALVRLPGLLERPIWQDEAVTLLQVSGHSSPTWPDEPTSVRKLQADLFAGTATLAEIYDGLQRTDVHPPGYYWTLSIWSRWFGTSLDVARVFSLVCSLATIGVLYLLLLRAGYVSPAVPTVIYALSASAVHYGQEARPYALAVLLVISGALVAYLGSEGGGRDSNTVYSLVAGMILGLAFCVHYLSVSPAIAVLSWLVVRHWHQSRQRALAGSAGFLIVALLSLPALSSQIAARPTQFAGFVGIGAELRALFVQCLLTVWSPTKETLSIAPAVYVGFLALGFWTWHVLWRNRPTGRRPLWSLLLGLLVAPALGVFALDLTLDKQLHLPRYLAFAAPAMSVFLAHGISRLIGQRRKVGYLVLGGVLLVLWTQSWNLADDKMLGYPRGNMGTWIDSVRGPASVAVAVGAGYGRATPAAATYALESETDGGEADLLVIREGSHPAHTASLLRSYSHVWVVRSPSGRTATEETQLVEHLAASPEFIRDSTVGPATHFRNVADGL